MAATFEQQYEGVQLWIPFAYLLFFVLLIQVIVIDALKYVADFGAVLLFMLLFTGGVVIEIVYNRMTPQRTKIYHHERPIRFGVAAMLLPVIVIVTNPALLFVYGFNILMFFGAMVVLLFAGVEEYIFRVQIPRFFKGAITNPKFKKYGVIFGQGVGAVLFASLHIGVGMMAVFSALIAAILLAIIFEYSKSFLGIVAGHWGWNMLLLGQGLAIWLLVVAVLLIILSVRGYL